MHVVESKKGRIKFPLAEGTLKQPGNPTPRERRRKPRARMEVDTWSSSSSDDEKEQEMDPDDATSRAPHGVQPEDPESVDGWKITQDLLIRFHRAPRTKMFSLDESTCPVPLKYVDVVRTTVTNLEDESESRIEDIWCGTDENVASPLSQAWVA